MNEWQIKIVDSVYKFTRDVYIFRRLPNNDSEMIDGTVVKIGDSPKPSLELTPEQLQAFADALNENGFKPQGGFVEGQLVATERHLQDLRQMLKLK